MMGMMTTRVLARGKEAKVCFINIVYSIKPDWPR